MFCVCLGFFGFVLTAGEDNDAFVVRGSLLSIQIYKIKMLDQILPLFLSEKLIAEFLVSSNVYSFCLFIFLC